MVNNSTNNKLDDKIKNVLGNYQADFEANDWGKLESRLNTTSTTQKINSKYIITIIAALVIIAGGYLIFNNINSTTNESIETKKLDLDTTQPVIVKEEKMIPSTTPPSTKSTIQLIDSAKKINLVSEDTNKQLTAEEEISKTTYSKSKKKDKKNKTAEEDSSNPEKVYIMGNEPIFGDMLDSSKGIIRVTKEKEETKKAAQSKSSDVPVGWNTFMLKNVNIDSLKQYRKKKDSIK